MENESSEDPMRGDSTRCLLGRWQRSHVTKVATRWCGWGGGCGRCFHRACCCRLQRRANEEVVDRRGGGRGSSSAWRHPNIWWALVARSAPVNRAKKDSLSFYPNVDNCKKLTVLFKLAKNDESKMSLPLHCRNIPPQRGKQKIIT